MNADDWLIGLAGLSERVKGLDLTVDLPTLSIVERWGLYAFLTRVRSASEQ